MLRTGRQWLLDGRVTVASVAGLVLAVVLAGTARAADDFPPHAKVLEGFTKVVSTADGSRSLYTLWTRAKDSQMYAELPTAFASQKHFIALTVASGERFAGLQAGDAYVYWRRYNKRLALIMPELETRSSGDSESKASVQRLFTGRVLLEVPIVTMGPGGGPVIDMDALLVQKAPVFFGPTILNRTMPGLFKLAKARAFPQNIEVAFELPASNGTLKTIHYSISLIPATTTYKPRVADERIGYFTTTWSDLGKYDDEQTRTRYINRWHLEKADKKLKMSPPKQPIVFYIEHTTPIRYRRWVREGILAWNKAFERVGISDAIEVRYQDATTKTHMDKDPEDVRYNFVRWLNNDVGTAIGPSRVNPTTGQILDADIILTDGWIRHYEFQFTDLLPKIAMEGYGPEMLAFLAENPRWDPRLQLAPHSERESLRAKILREAAQPMSGHPAGQVDPRFLGGNVWDGLIGRTSQVNGLCLAASGKAFDMALMRLHLSALPDAADTKDGDGGEKGDKEEPKKEEPKKEEKKDESTIDGMPESFVGPLLAHLVAHEVGHTLGLRHNFKGSSLYTVKEVNSEEIKGKRPLASSVMDYTPININMESGEVQGDYSMNGIGPYDEWAIEYGYTTAKDLKPILARVAEPALQYATDEDTVGPDPLARRYDFGKDPLEFAENQIRLARYHRDRLIDKFVKDGESWSRARKGYELTLSLQMRSVSMMANWLGGTFIHRDRKGDPNGRPPIEVVPAEQQRKALKFVTDSTFRDEAYGLNPELLRRMVQDRWLDGSGFRSAFQDASWPVHDRIMGLQAATLTMLMNPSTLRRVYDNEFRVPADQDTLTLPELLETVRASIWTELDKAPEGEFTARKPWLSSLRRNLQREHVERLIDLSMPGGSSSAGITPVQNLARMQLRELQTKLETVLKEHGAKLDAYSRAHLTETTDQIQRALAAEYIYNARSIGGARGTTVRFHGESEGGSE